MFDWMLCHWNWCATTRFPLYRSRQTIRLSQPGIWKAIGRTYSYWTVGFLVFKFIKSNEKLEGCARKRINYDLFYIYCKKLYAWLLFASLAEKTPGHLFVVKFYGRVNTIKVMSNQSVNPVSQFILPPGQLAPRGASQPRLAYPPGGKLSRDILPPALVILSPGGQAVQAGLSCPPPI